MNLAETEDIASPLVCPEKRPSEKVVNEYSILLVFFTKGETITIRSNNLPTRPANIDCYYSLNQPRPQALGLRGRQPIRPGNENRVH